MKQNALHPRPAFGQSDQCSRTGQASLSFSSPPPLPGCCLLWLTGRLRGWCSPSRALGGGLPLSLPPPPPPRTVWVTRLWLQAPTSYKMSWRDQQACTAARSRRCPCRATATPSRMRQRQLWSGARKKGSKRMGVGEGRKKWEVPQQWSSAPQTPPKLRPALLAPGTLREQPSEQIQRLHQWRTSNISLLLLCNFFCSQDQVFGKVAYEILCHNNSG